MKMEFKKEVVNSVVYETHEPKAAVRSVYVSKDWLTQKGHDFRKPINLEVTCNE